jgi:hypothetical protein
VRACGRPVAGLREGGEWGARLIPTAQAIGLLRRAGMDGHRE